MKVIAWTDNEWPSDHGSEWTVMVIALQLSIRLKQTTWKFKEIEYNVLKISLIYTSFVKYFQITYVHICISLNTKDIMPILHTCLTLSWSCLCSTALVLGRASEIDKNNSVKLVLWEVKHFWKIKFLITFMTVIDI